MLKKIKQAYFVHRDILKEKRQAYFLFNFSTVIVFGPH